MAPALIALGAIAPMVLRFLGKDNEADVADKVVAIGKELTGQDDAAKIAEALKASPELAARFQQMANELVIAEMSEETKRLAEVNATMRAELASGDAFVRRCRPFFMYVMAVTWALQILGLSVAIVLEPGRAAPLINAVSDLTTMWSIALAVVGVYVKVRSDDKKTAVGAPAPTALESIAGVLGKR